MPTLSPAQIAGYASAAGFTGSQVLIMTAIALGESGGRTDITHANKDGSTDYGVWQINSVHSDILATGNWSDPAANARMAYAVWKKQGYRAWSVYKSGLKAEHLTAASQGARTPITPQTLPTASIPNPLDGLAKLTDPHMWLRIAMFQAGVLLLVLGFVSLAWGNLPASVKSVTKTVAKAVVTKKVT